MAPCLVAYNQTVLATLTNFHRLLLSRFLFLYSLLCPVFRVWRFLTKIILFHTLGRRAEANPPKTPQPLPTGVRWQLVVGGTIGNVGVRWVVGGDVYVKGVLKSVWWSDTNWIFLTMIFRAPFNQFMADVIIGPFLFWRHCVTDSRTANYRLL